MVLQIDARRANAKKDMLERTLFQAVHNSRLGTGLGDVGLVLLVIYILLYATFPN